jgi:uncharacterized membrane protein YbhN (UPF0104 family)
VLYGSLLVLALLLPVAAIALGRAPADASRHPWWNRLAAARVAVSAHGPALGRSLPDSVLVQLLSATALWLAARAAGADAALLAVLAIAAPIFVAAAIPISMAGFGPREVTAGLAFAAIGASSSVGVAAAILYGLTSVLQGVAATPLLAMQRERPEVPQP